MIMSKSIVINREYGSGGRIIGEMIAKKLNMPFFDTNILTEVVKKKGFRPDVLETFDERIVGSVLYNLSMMASHDPLTMDLPYEMYEALSDTIIASAQTEDCIFIGRCANKILEEAKIPFLSVFIYESDMEKRKERAIHSYGIPEENAEAYIKKKDKMRRAYQQFFTHTKFDDYREYDLCLDSGKLGEETCAELIIKALYSEKK